MGRAELLREGLEALDLDVRPEAQTLLLRFLEELLHWNRSINLTAVRDFEEGIEKHLVDSLTPLPLLTGKERLLDMGSGGGLPGIPLKIARPDLGVVSVETVGKKATFQRHAIRTLGLEGIEVRQVRAENLPAEGLSGKFDFVISRAFASLHDFASLALPCLAPGGRLLAMKGPEGEGELTSSTTPLADLGLECTELRRLRLPVSGAARTLIVLTRVHFPFFPSRS